MAASRHKAALAVAAITLLSGHVAPSVDDNNRYLKLTPLGDRVRLAYTVFFGEVPGAAERPAIDTNRDGRIDDAEARAFGNHLGAQVADGLVVVVDGHATKVAWTTVDVGMGSPVVRAGSFSVDLVTYLCLARPRGKHQVRVRDRFRVTHPGETEVRVEDSPGVTIDHAKIGVVDDPTHDYRFIGPGGPLTDDGLDLAFTAGDKSTVTADGVCKDGGRTARRGARTVGYVVFGALALVALAGAAFALVRRRARA